MEVQHVIEFQRGGVAGFVHRPTGDSCGGVALTHGAGGNCNAQILQVVAKAFVAARWTVLRYNLPFRRDKPFGPPMPNSAAADQAGIRDALSGLREIVDGPIVAGGNSYGGRQTTIVAAEDPQICQALLALSYPLHPPRQPQKMRTAHWPSLRTPIVFVHGTRDEFGTVDEIRSAIQLIPAPHRFLVIDGAGHDLKSGKFDIESNVVREMEQLLFPPAAERIVKLNE